MNRTKYLKLIPLMLLTVFLLSGCVSLQTLKDEHAVYKDSTKKTIIWKGNEYLFLTNNEELDLYVDANMAITLNVTDSDVPTLLKSHFGEYAMVSTDENIISVYSDIYCIKDQYDKFEKRLAEGQKLDFYASQYDKFFDDFEEYNITLLHTFTAEEKKILEKIEKNSVLKEMHLEWDDYDLITDMYLVSEDGLFRRYRDVGLCRTEKGEYFWEKFEEDEYKHYMIPKEYEDTIEELFADEIKMADQYAQYIDENYDEYEEF